MMSPHVPGNSKASLTLMIDAARSAYALAQAKLMKEHNLSQCPERVQLVDALITQAPPDMPQDGWREDWTFFGCGRRTTTLSIDFVPDETGTKFIVGR
jgi:hypothetical protein